MVDVVIYLVQVLLSHSLVSVNAHLLRPLQVNVVQTQTRLDLPILCHLIKHLYLFNLATITPDTFRIFLFYDPLLAIVCINVL